MAVRDGTPRRLVHDDSPHKGGDVNGGHVFRDGENLQPPHVDGALVHRVDHPAVKVYQDLVHGHRDHLVAHGLKGVH